MSKKILIIGASGLIGNSLFKYFLTKKNIFVFGTIRSAKALELQSNFDNSELFTGVDLLNKNNLESIFDKVLPDVVINCVGITSKSKEIENYHTVISLNSLLPHYLSTLSLKYKARLIQMSTDCVFSGSKGNYVEDDFPDAPHLYGRSKFLGEINYLNSITLRTSTIGHEVNSSRGLVDWFLSQKESVDGYKKAIFSGLTSIEISRVIYEYILFNTNLAGLYHLSADPINKYDLLLMIKNIYNTDINIIPDHKKIIIDRSLDSTKFRKATGFLPKSWPLMIKEMKSFG
jgi:dTDP-4-dehydrorhamnose reductase